MQGAALASLKKKLFVRSNLATLDKKIMTKSSFIAYCTSSPRTPENFRMTEAEAENYLKSLVKSCDIVPVGEDLLCTSPHSVVNSVHLKLGLPPLQRGLPQLVEARKNLKDSLVPAREACVPKTVLAIKREREFWSVTALLSGVQMTVLAYLTFLVYGWDIMEPVTFFITSLTALASYMYFLYFNAEHTYEDVDDHIVETALEKELRSVSVDLKSVLDSVKMIKELDLAVPDDDEEFEVITQCKSEK